MKTTALIVTICACLAAPGGLFAQAYTEGTLSFPGAAASPVPWGIDSNDQIVGVFEDYQGSHGFLWSNGVAAQIDYPGASATQVTAINSTSGIAGYRFDYLGNTQAVRFAGGRYIAVKNGQSKWVTGINAAGTMVGFDNTGHGFITVNGVFTNVVPAPCTSLNAPIVEINGINTAGDFVGVCIDGVNAQSLGFARIGGIDQVISVFGQATFPAGINDSGTIAGFYVDGSGEHGFQLSGGVASSFNLSPSSTYSMTEIHAINNKGSLVGRAYNAQTNQWVGFYALTN